MKIKGAFPVRWAAQDGKPGTGVTIVSQTVKYAVSTSGTTHPTSGWKTSVPSVSDGQYLWTWVCVRYSDGTETNSYSVARQGIDGRGIKSSSVTYSQQATSVDPATITDWGSFPSNLKDGYWLYTKTHIVYSDDAATDSYSVSQVGIGSYYAGCQEYWAIGVSDTTPPEGAANPGTYVNGQEVVTTWSQERVSPTNDMPYLWNFEVSADSRGNKYVTQSICIGNFAKGIVSIVETYAISAYGSPNREGAHFPSDIAPNDWQDEQNASAPTEEKRYQWNRTVVTYNNGDTDTHYHVSAVKGIDGKGSVYIDLDNENDSMLFDGQGNAVVGDVTSNIFLYENGERVTSAPTFSVKEKSSYLKASISSNSVLKVSNNGFGLSSSSSGYVIISCTYKNVEYTARMTVKKIAGTDKYEISLNHNAISYNETEGTISNPTINVCVYRTSQNGTRTMVGSGGTTIAGLGLSAKIYPDGISTNAIDISFSTQGVATFTVTSSYASSWNSFAVVLFKSGSEIDRETVPINKAKNGKKGEGAIVVDLDNENDSMLYDGDDNPISEPVTSNATLYSGEEKVTSGITWSIDSYDGCTLMNSGAATDTSYSRSAYPTAAWVSTTGVVTINGLTSSQAYVVVMATYNGNEYRKTLNVKKLRGVDKYELIISPSALTYNSSEAKVNGAASKEVIVEIWKTSQNGERKKLTDFNNQSLLTISVTPSTQGSITPTKQTYGCTFPVSSSMASSNSFISVVLSKGSLTLDSETIPIAKTANGVGESGPAAKSIYANSFEKPATPVGATPWASSCSIWSEIAVNDDDVNIRQQGDWYKDDDGYTMAPAIGTSQSSVQTLMFVTTNDNQTIYLRAKCSTSYTSYLYIGIVDSTTPTDAGCYIRRLTGTNQDTGDMAITVASAGNHFICIAYTRASGTDTYVKFICGKRFTWRSDAKTYSNNGEVETWNTPVKVTGEQSESSPQTKANILLQSAFLSTRMDKWVVQNGSTTDGIEGRNGYTGNPNYQSSYRDLIAQNVYEDGHKALLADTWYTLSFWAKAAPYIQISKYLTSTAYGFANELCYFEAGVTNTIWVNGYISSNAQAAGKSLRVFVHGDGDSLSTWGDTIATVSITNTHSTTASVKFTVSKTGVYQIQAYVYLEPGGGNSAVEGHTATVNWYRIDRGKRIATYLYPHGASDQAAYTCMDVNAGRIKDGQRLSYSATDNSVSWQLTDVWTRHTLTFKTRTSLTSASQYAQRLLFRMNPSSNAVSICMPKLEQGTVATAYCTNDNDVADMAADETGFPNDRGVWSQSPSEPYLWDSSRRDYVAYEISGEWRRFFVKNKGMTVPNGTAPTAGGNTYWEQGSVINTLLVNTIVGSNASLTFAKSNRLLITNSSGTVSAGLGGAENGDTDIPFWIGKDYANRATAPFRVNLKGEFWANNAHINGDLTAQSGDTVVRISTQASEEGMTISRSGVNGTTKFIGSERAKADLFTGTGTTETIGAYIANESKSYYYADLEEIFNPEIGTQALSFQFYGNKQDSAAFSVDLLDTSVATREFHVDKPSFVSIEPQNGDCVLQTTLYTGSNKKYLDDTLLYSNIRLYLTYNVTEDGETYEETIDLAEQNISVSSGNADKYLGKNVKLKWSGIKLYLMAGTYTLHCDSRIEGYIDREDFIAGSITSVAISNAMYKLNVVKDPVYYRSLFFGNGFSLGSSDLHHFQAISADSVMDIEAISGNSGWRVCDGLLYVRLGGVWYLCTRNNSGLMYLSKVN